MEYNQNRDIAYWNSKLALHLSISFFISVVGIIIGALFIPPAAARICGVVALLSLVFAAFFRRKRSITMGFTYFFMLIEGISLYPAILYYLTDLGASIFISIFATGVIVFAVMWIYSLTTKKDFTGLGGGLFACLIAIIICTLINVIFFRSTGFHLIINIVSVVVFTIYVLYDISTFKKAVLMGYINETNDLGIYVINLYLDLINIILDLLSIASDLDD